MRRDVLARAADTFAALADPDGKTPERFEIVYMTGHAPDPGVKPHSHGGRTFAVITAGLPPKD